MSHITPLLNATPLLNYQHPEVQSLLATRGWPTLPMQQRIGAIYDFVRNEIAFGYNAADALAASQVLADGHGQCNTKSILLMALLRGAGIPCRLHGFTIYKRLQRGAVTGLAYWLAPQHILHSWVEVPLGERWVNLEGFILDAPYLHSVQRRFGNGAFCGYGVATEDLACPSVEWHGEDTYIQRTGISADLGVFTDPDSFYARYPGNLSGWRAWLFQRVIRQQLNRTVAKVRAGHW